jgi:hypothetical protein
LKDDSDFQWETGCNLDDERLVVGVYDLSGLRSRIVAGVLATGVAATTAVIVGDGVPVIARAAGWSVATVVKPVLGAAGGAAILAGAYWLGVQSRSSEPVPQLEVAPIHAPVMPAPASLSTGILVPGRVEEPALTPPIEAAIAAPQHEPANSASLRNTPPPDSDQAPAAGTASADPATRVVTAPAVPHSDVPDQMATLYKADDAMGRGDYAEAERLYTQVREWPDGDLAPEAELGLLRARSSRQDFVGTAQLAEQIQDDPAFSDKRQEILRLWAESLVQLDRCTEALRVAEKLSVRSAAPTRKSCRGVRREGD